MMILVDENGNRISINDVNYDKGYLDPEDRIIEGEKVQWVTYRLFTKEQLRRREIADEIEELKKQLANTDFHAIKYSEGWYTEEEYEPIKEERESYREKIRELEKELEELENI